MGVVSTNVKLNVNRQAKRLPKPTEPMLAVMRFDDEAGRPIAVLVNYAAHPTITNNKLMKYSADYPGFMKRKVEAELQHELRLHPGGRRRHERQRQIARRPGLWRNAGRRRDSAGAGGPDRGSETSLDRKAKSSVSVSPAAAAASKTAAETTRGTRKPAQAGYAALRQRFTMQFKDGVPAELNTILLNGDVAIVGASGEFFCNHSNRLKERAYVPRTLFFGYCNGHSMYFPTIEAASEGGYGADSLVARAEIGAGEKMMDQALMNLYLLLGKFKAADVARK